MLSRGAVILLALAAGCYEPPAGGPCSITCTTECPGDLTCSNGFCVGDGDVCAPQFIQVSTGGGFACAIDSQEGLFCWGSNEHHVMAESDELAFPLAQRIGNDRWQTISAGRGHACGISNGRLLCWGANERGQITGAITGDVMRPTEIEVTGGPETWRAVYAGWTTTCAIGEDGRLYCWGENSSGELGIGTMNDTAFPTPVMSDLRDWTTVTMGWTGSSGHTCAISSGSGLHCWGSNTNSQLGIAEPGSIVITTPTPVLAGTTVVSVAASAYSTCATTSSNELYCWGFAGYGGLGDPAVVPLVNANATPMLGSAATDWTSVSANQYMVCGLRAGELYCWGTTASGIGYGDGIWAPAAPAMVGPIASGVSAVSLGANERIDEDLNITNTDVETTCFLANGAVRCWGDNRYGQLAQGAATLAARPVEISGPRVWRQLATGYSHACGVDDAGMVACWGLALAGALDGIVGGTAAAPCTTSPCDQGAPKDVRAGSAVAVGTHHSCALSGSEITCWGDDSFQQLGAPGIGPAQSVVPGTWTDLFDVHGNAVCGRSGSEAFCWGNSLEVSSVPTRFPELDATTSIQVGGIVQQAVPGFGCYLNAGELFCFGENTLGQYGNGRFGLCGDAVCDADECTTCPTDCPTQCPTCGNGLCDHAEKTTTCSVDCGTAIASKLGRTYQSLAVGWELDNQGAFACGVTTDGRVECWGRNRGQALAPAGDIVESPIASGSLAGCTAVAVGEVHACALCGTGIKCWGDARDGALGNGVIATAIERVPVDVDVTLAPGDRWVQISAGISYTCARSDQGRGFCWGSNRHGALGTGATASTIPVVVRAK